MNLSEYTDSPTPFFEAFKPLLASSDASSQLVAEATRELLSIQSDLAAASFAKVVTSLVPAFSPGNPSYALWQLPADYQAELERGVHALMTSVGVLSRLQQQMAELQGQSLTHGVQDAAKVIARVNGLLASRRVSAEVINFSDRRAVLASAPTAQRKSIRDADRASGPHAKNQATG